MGDVTASAKASVCENDFVKSHIAIIASKGVGAMESSGNGIDVSVSMDEKTAESK